MKGLRDLPQIDDLRVAYEELDLSFSRARQVEQLDMKRLALLSQWARLDPRLAELFCGYLQRNWSQLRSVELLEALTEQPWPRAILVPLRFVELAALDESHESEGGGHESQQASANSLRLFALRALIDLIDRSFPQKTYDLFFIPLQQPNRVILRNELRLRGMAYVRSGYIGSASLLAKGRSPQSRTILDAGARRSLLEERVRQMKIGDRLTVEDYLELCAGKISRRQAQRDLAVCDKLRSIGHTRRLRYLKSASR